MTASATPITRRFIQVGDRRVHYLRAGEGPPAVLIHASPANAWQVLREIEHLAPNFTCFAFDTPGYGLSTPLPLPELKVADLADGLAEAMRTVGIPPCPIYGTHTGAAIALELAVGHPDLVTGVVFDALPVFTAEDCEEILSGQFQPMPVDKLGGHFSQAWTRFRDQSIWFPWFQRLPDHLNPCDLGTPESIHNWAMMYFHAAKSYAAAYRAVISPGERPKAAIKALEQPAVFMALETDMLYPHLDRMPPLRPNQAIHAIGKSHENKFRTAAEAFARFTGKVPAPALSSSLESSAAVERQFVDGAHGQIHVRYAGNKSAPSLLLLHDAPGSAQFLEPLITALSTHYFVCAPDLPGCGESDPLPGEAPGIADYAAALTGLCASAGLTRPIVYGIGLGSSLAIALAEHAPGEVAGLVLRGLLLPATEERATLRSQYAPPIRIEPDGSHWYRTWLMLRDSLVYWPWYDRRYQSVRRVDADFSAEHMHAWTFDVMKQHASYQHVIHAALDHHAEAALASLQVPWLLCRDGMTPLSAYNAKAKSLFPQASVCTASDDASHAVDISRCLKAHP